MTRPKIAVLTFTALFALTCPSLAQTDLGSTSLQKNFFYNQSSAATPTLDPRLPYQFEVGILSGSTGTVLNTSTVTPPSGSAGTITLNYEQLNQGGALYFQPYFFTKSAMDTAFGNGTYNLTIHTSTPNTYNTQLAFGADNYPSVVPQFTNGTWSNGYLQINPSQSYTFTWPSFVGGDIYFSTNGNSHELPADGAHNSYTIPAGTYQANGTYQVNLGFANNNGNPGADYFEYLLTVNVQTGTINPGIIFNAVLKVNDLQQTSASAPTATSNIGQYFSPYSFAAQVSTPGSITAPNGVHTLAYRASHADNEFYSGLVSSQGNLDSAYPDGNYTLSNSAVVSLTGDVYPDMPQVTQVNGAAPVWNGQGQLVLDPTVANTLTWAPFTTTNGSHTFANSGYIYADFRILASSDSLVQNQAAGFAGQSAFNTLTIPANTLTPGNLYATRLEYALSSSVTSGGTNTYNAAAYMSENDLVVLASTADAFNGTVVSANLKLSPWYGYYTSSGYPLVFEYNLGYQYAFPTTGGVYLYDYATGHFWYTQSDYFPTLYDFTLNTFLYYYTNNANGAPRYFYDYTTGHLITQ